MKKRSKSAARCVWLKKNLKMNPVLSTVQSTQFDNYKFDIYRNNLRTAPPCPSRKRINFIKVRFVDVVAKDPNKVYVLIFSFDKQRPFSSIFKIKIADFKLEN